MENLDLILLTFLLVVLFIAFLISSYREFTGMSKNEFKSDEKRGGAAVFVNFFSKIFTHKS